MATKQLSVVVRVHDQASAVVRGIASRMVGSFRTVLSVGADVSLVVTGISRAVRTLQRVVVDNEAANELDRIGKASRRLGESTQFISKLSYVAKLADVDFGRLNAATEKLQENIGKIANGSASAEMLGWFDRLGVRIRDDVGGLRSMEALLPEIAEAMGRLEPAERVAAARQLFGRGGTGMLNVTEGGPRGIVEGFRQAEQLGAVYSRRMTDAAEEYNDAISRVGIAWLGVKSTVVGEVGPALADFLNVQAFRIAQIPNAVRGISRTIRESVSEDPAAAAAARGRVKELGLAAVDVVATGLLAVAKTAAQVFVETALVVFEALAPRLSDVVRDIAAPTLNAIPGVDIAVSDRARLAQLRRERTGLVATLKTAQSVEGARATSRIYGQNPDGNPFTAGISYEKSRADVERTDREIKQLAAKIELSARESDAALSAVVQSAGSNISQVFSERFGELRLAKDRFGTILDEFTEVGIDYRAAHDDFIDANRPREQVQRFDQLAASAARYAGVLKDRLVGAMRDVRKELAELSPLAELRARSLSVVGDERGAARLRQRQAQSAELLSAITGGKGTEYVDTLREVQRLERQRFDTETAALRVIEPLTQARERYGEEIARNAALVEAGTLQEFQATRQNLQSAESVRRLGEAAKAQIDTIITANPALAKFLEEYRDNVVRILGEIPTPRVSRSPTFGEGVEDGIDRLIERAQDFRAQGVEAFDTVADIGIGRLSSALTQGQTSFKEFAESAIRDVAELTTRLLLLRIVASGLKAFGFGGGDAAAGVAAVDSLDTSTGAGVSFLSLNRGGRVGWPAGFARGGGLGGDFRLLGGPNVNRDTGVFAGTAGELVVSRNQVRGNGGHANLIAGLNRGDYGGGGGGGTVINFNQVNHFAAGANVDSRTLAALQKASIDGLPGVIERNPAYRARMKGALQP